MATSILEFLSNPASYAERPQQVEVRETHISWVFLTDAYAYKLKKPVKFEFLDFSTLDLRKKACDDEVRLNHRLAPDVYLDVLPIGLDSSRFLSFKPVDASLDWVVKMRRLDERIALSSLIPNRLVTPANVAILADRLARFYQDLPPISLQPESYRNAIDAHLRSNRRELLKYCQAEDSDMVKRIHSRQLTFLHSFPQVLDDRVCDGRIVEGHGDLRPEHIYLTMPPTIIDCLEFSKDLRQVDVIDELSFLAMECRLRRAGWIGEQIIAHYSEITGDCPSSNLLTFYETYRACVRAKVGLLRETQLSGTEKTPVWHSARNLLRFADEQSQRLMPPSLVVIRGPSGSGKSTIAIALSGLLGMDLLQTDAIRHDLFSVDAPSPGYNQGRYSDECRNRVYDELFSRAERAMSHGLSVVLDGTFATKSLQERVIQLALHHGGIALLVNCHCAPELAGSRIMTRHEAGGSLSEASLDTLRRQLADEETPKPHMPQCDVDTSCALPLINRKVLDGINAQLQRG